jgi:hypothetical protein
MMITKYQAFKVLQEILIDDVLDLQLRQLVWSAQQYPVKSGERRKVLNKLITNISRQKDNCLEIELAAEVDKKFSVEIILGESKVTEEFVV